MKKKDLRNRNDQLRWELTQAQRLAGHQIRQINEHRMELAILKVESERQAVETPEETVVVKGVPEAGRPCPTCGNLRVASAPVEPATKMCPECAEEVRGSARKCRYCDYRFDGSKTAAPNGGALVSRLGSARGT